NAVLPRADEFELLEAQVFRQPAELGVVDIRPFGELHQHDERRSLVLLPARVVALEAHREMLVADPLLVRQVILRDLEAVRAKPRPDGRLQDLVRLVGRHAGGAAQLMSGSCWYGRGGTWSGGRNAGAGSPGGMSERM